MFPRPQTERHAQQVNPRETSALRRPSSFNGSKPTVTRKSTRRISRLSDESPSQPANPTHYRPNTTDSSLRLGRPTMRRCCHHHDSPYDHHVVVRNAHSSQPSFATYQLRCRIWNAVGTRLRPPRRADGERFPSLSGYRQLGRRDITSGTGRRASWESAGEPTNRFPASSNTSVVAVRTRGGHDASAAATSHDKDSAFTKTPPRGELARPATNTPRRVDQTETSLSSGKRSLTW